jgi:small subunit ribosomal protein S21
LNLAEPPGPELRQADLLQSLLGGTDRLIHIEVHPNESIDAAIKRFNMKLQQSGLLREVKEHAHYEKPSEKRRRARRRSKNRQ